MAQIHTHAAGEHDSAFAGLLVNDANWAFGSDFEDPLAGVDTTVPDGVDAGDLALYCLMLADDALVYSHRLSEWCSNAPDLEEDLAIANVALDLLGQARLLLARAAAADPRSCRRCPMARRSHLRTRWRSSVAIRSSATFASPSCPTATSPS
ncbi:Phenylacetic acid catabolic protein [Phytohabitans flavus]|uniref:Phenylacetic acid catabolic protein n=1 Tax=Phytohabitans flavus TaxID=1076124 RepID=UPI00362E304A